MITRIMKILVSSNVEGTIELHLPKNLCEIDYPFPKMGWITLQGIVFVNFLELFRQEPAQQSNIS